MSRRAGEQQPHVFKWLHTNKQLCRANTTTHYMRVSTSSKHSPWWRDAVEQIPRDVIPICGRGKLHFRFKMFNEAIGWFQNQKPTGTFPSHDRTVRRQDSFRNATWTAAARRSRSLQQFYSRFYAPVAQLRPAGERHDKRVGGALPGLNRPPSAEALLDLCCSREDLPCDCWSALYCNCLPEPAHTVKHICSVFLEVFSLTQVQVWYLNVEITFKGFKWEKHQELEILLMMLKMYR